MLQLIFFNNNKFKVMKLFLFIIGICITIALMSHQSATSPAIDFTDKAELKAFGKPDEVREFPLGKVELVKIGGATVGRAIFQPGWKWSESVQPLAKTASCEAPHFQYHVSGVLMVKMDDGTILECKPGDVSLLPMGHDAWVVGTEPAIVVDFQGMIDYAKVK